MENSNSPMASESSASAEFSLIPMTRRQIIKNFAVICIAFQLLFIPFNNLITLQSTIHQEKGVASLGIQYGFLTFCSLLFPKYAIEKFGCKNVFVISMVGFTPYMAIQGHFTWYTMIPTTILSGFSASLLWSSQCRYVNLLAVYNTLLILKDKRILNLPRIIQARENTESTRKIVDSPNENPEPNSSSTEIQHIDSSDSIKIPSSQSEPITGYTNDATSETPTRWRFFRKRTRKMDFRRHTDEYEIILSWVCSMFFGIFEFFYRISDIWGNLISYFVLREDFTEHARMHANCTCSAYNCEESSCLKKNLEQGSQQKKDILAGISVGLTAVGIIIGFIFLDTLRRIKKPGKFTLKHLTSVFTFMTRKKCLLLIFLTSYIGLLDGFYVTDFTKTFVACALGVDHVGLITVAYGLLSALIGPVSGGLVKLCGRIPVMLGGVAFGLGAIAYLLTWNPRPGSLIPFFLGASLLGIAVGSLSSQMKGYYGALFDKEEAAFGVYYFWNSLGFMASFAYSDYLCTYIKLYIVIVVSLIGTVGYLETEFEWF